MPRFFRVKQMKKSNQPRGGKSRKAKYCNTSGRPNRYTPGWRLDATGNLVHVGVDADGNDDPLPLITDEAAEAEGGKEVMKKCPRCNAVMEEECYSDLSFVHVVRKHEVGGNECLQRQILQLKEVMKAAEVEGGE